jgi:hypothetical protein
MTLLIRTVSGSPARRSWCYRGCRAEAEIDARAAAKPPKPVTVIHHSCITDAYAQLRAQRGMQIRNPQNPLVVEQGHEPHSATGSVDATGELSNQAVCAPGGSVSSIAVLLNSFHGSSHRRTTGSATDKRRETLAPRESWPDVSTIGTAA